jgi:hypothetical protein
MDHDDTRGQTGAATCLEPKQLTPETDPATGLLKRFLLPLHCAEKTSMTPFDHLIVCLARNGWRSIGPSIGTIQWIRRALRIAQTSADEGRYRADITLEGVGLPRRTATADFNFRL